MKQTPIKRAIDCTESPDLIGKLDANQRALVREYLRRFIPYEKECFEETYNNGALCDMHVRFNADDSTTTVHLSAQDYFNQTYKQ